MSATITLEEALARTVKGPVKWIGTNKSPKKPCYLSGEDGYAGCALDGFSDNPVEPALLAHCRNRFPDLVSRLEALQKWAEQMGGFNSPQWADLPELIERANKVQLP